MKTLRILLAVPFLVISLILFILTVIFMVIANLIGNGTTGIRR